MCINTSLRSTGLGVKVLLGVSRTVFSKSSVIFLAAISFNLVEFSMFEKALFIASEILVDLLRQYWLWFANPSLYIAMLQGRHLKFLCPLYGTAQEIVFQLNSLHTLHFY